MNLEQKTLDLFYQGGGKSIDEINKLVDELPCSQKIKNSILESFAIGQKLSENMIKEKVVGTIHFEHLNVEKENIMVGGGEIKSYLKINNSIVRNILKKNYPELNLDEDSDNLWDEFKEKSLDELNSVVNGAKDLIYKEMIGGGDPYDPDYNYILNYNDIKKNLLERGTITVDTTKALDKFDFTDVKDNKDEICFDKCLENPDCVASGKRKKIAEGDNACYIFDQNGANKSDINDSENKFKTNTISFINFRENDSSVLRQEDKELIFRLFYDI